MGPRARDGPVGREGLGRPRQDVHADPLYLLSGDDARHAELDGKHPRSAGDVVGGDRVVRSAFQRAVEQQLHHRDERRDLSLLQSDVGRDQLPPVQVHRVERNLDAREDDAVDHRLQAGQRDGAAHHQRREHPRLPGLDRGAPGRLVDQLDQRADDAAVPVRRRSARISCELAGRGAESASGRRAYVRRPAEGLIAQRG